MTEKVKCPACECRIEKIQELSMVPLDMPYKIKRIMHMDDGSFMNPKTIGEVFCCSNGHVFNTWDGTEIKTEVFPEEYLRNDGV